MRFTLCTDWRVSVSSTVSFLAFIAVFAVGQLAGQQPDLRQSHAQDIVIRNKQVIDADWMRSLAVSPSGKQVALVQTKVINGGGIRVRDLPPGRFVRDYAIDREVWQVAWSPDGRRLYYVPSYGDQCGVLELTTAKVIQLPGGCVQRGPSRSLHRIAWLDDSTVVGYLGSEGTECNLSSLTCEGLSARNLARLKPRPNWDHAAISANANGPTALFATSKADQGWRSLDLPGQVLDLDWLPAVDGVVVSLEHSASRHEVVMVRFGVSRGGSRYFGFAAPWATDAEAAEKFAAATQDTTYTLAATVFAAQINPLNGRAIGPNRNERKAELQFVRQCGESLYWRVAGLYAPTQVGDVIGHVRTNLDGYQWSGWMAIERTNQLDSLPACEPLVAASGNSQSSARANAPAATGRSVLSAISDTAKYSSEFGIVEGVVDGPVASVRQALRSLLAKELPIVLEDSLRNVIIARGRGAGLGLWRRRTVFASMREESAKPDRTVLQLKVIDVSGSGRSEYDVRGEVRRLTRPATDLANDLLAKLRKTHPKAR